MAGAYPTWWCPTSSPTTSPYSSTTRPDPDATTSRASGSTRFCLLRSPRILQDFENSDGACQLPFEPRQVEVHMLGGEQATIVESVNRAQVRLERAASGSVPHPGARMHAGQGLLDDDRV